MAGQGGISFWAPGLWLMRRLSLPHRLAALLMAAWAPLLLALPLLWNAAAPLFQGTALGRLHGLPALGFDADVVPDWAPWGLLAFGVVASVYLAACASRSTLEGLERLRRRAENMADGQPELVVQDVGSEELRQAWAALGAAGASVAQLHEAARHRDAVVLRSAQELGDGHRALQLHALELRAAIGEMARRTVALCGMLDSDMKDAECAGVDLDAIQDEELQSLRLMAALRSRLLVLTQHCQALADAARSAAASPHDARGESVDALLTAAAAEVTHCHQLSERVGGAERHNERRIASMHRSADRLVQRTERGMREGQQLMVLTRQAEASLTAALQRLETMATSCASLCSLVEPSATATAAAVATLEHRAT
jgi:hypothetical protein